MYEVEKAGKVFDGVLPYGLKAGEFWSELGNPCSSILCHSMLFSATWIQSRKITIEILFFLSI